MERIEEIVNGYDMVLGIHDLVVHNYGPGRVMLSVHVEVPASGDIVHMHDMIDNIEHRLRRELNCNAVIHMDPVSVGDERTNELKEKVREIIDGMHENFHFHDFRIVDGPTHTNVIFDVEVPYSVKTEDKEIVSYLQKKIRELGGDGQEYYAQEIFDTEEFIANLDRNAVKVDHSVYDYIVYDSSSIERPFAVALDNDPDVKMFFKIPNRFKIETPIGTYNPDWAVYLTKNGEEKLYFVLETKGSTSFMDLRTREQLKIHCGKKHFEALDNGIELQVATDWNELKSTL